MDGCTTYKDWKVEAHNPDKFFFKIQIFNLKFVVFFKFYSYFVVLGMVVQYIMALLDIYVIFFALIIFKDFNEIFFFFS
jgi:hypothetical protein